MKLILNRLMIRQFKGIGDLDLHFDGEDAAIYGDNATGKTSIYDAILWLLFGKDSQDTASFTIKPLDAFGNKIPGTEPEVTAEFTYDGKKLALRKVLKEVWRKPTGQAQPIYDRDEVQAWVNDIPMKIDKEYAPYINDLIPEELFRIALHHSYFMRMRWDEKRKHLVSISNPDVDKELFLLEEFAGIEKVLDGAITDDARKRLMERRRILNKELDEIPARIDELQKTAVPRSQEDLTGAQQRKAEMDAELAEIDALLASGDETRKKITGIYADMNSLREKLKSRHDSLEQEAYADTLQAKKDYSVKENEFLSFQRQISYLEKTIPTIVSDMDSAKADVESLRIKWSEEDEKVFDDSGVPGTCAACGQPLPASRIEAARQKAFEQFEAAQSKILADIEAQGKRKQQEMQSLATDLERMRHELSDKKAKVQALIEEMDKLRGIINSPVPAINFSDDKACQEFKDGIQKLQTELDHMDSSQDHTGLLGRKKEIQMVIAMQDKILASEDQAKASQARIKDLLEQKSTLGKQIAAIDGQLDLLARFVSARCRLLEDHINELFPTIRWKLFEQLQNGGIKDCCTPTINGVPYADLNNAARINAGIEASRVICKAHGIECPCFVDNSESVNSLQHPSGQLIALVVSHDQQLRLEVA